MKKLKKSLLSSFTVILVGTLLLSHIVVYLFVQLTFRENSFESQDLNSSFIALFFFLLFIVGVAVYIYKRSIEPIFYDIETLKEYLVNISAKKYTRVCKIKYYVEFLEISLILKNIVKRASQKEKKSSKK